MLNYLRVGATEHTAPLVTVWIKTCESFELNPSRVWITLDPIRFTHFGVFLTVQPFGESCLIRHYRRDRDRYKLSLESIPLLFGTRALRSSSIIHDITTDRAIDLVLYGWVKARGWSITAITHQNVRHWVLTVGQLAARVSSQLNLVFFNTWFNHLRGFQDV
jgi:hypothetical protein